MQRVHDLYFNLKDKYEEPLTNQTKPKKKQNTKFMEKKNVVPFGVDVLEMQHYHDTKNNIPFLFIYIIPLFIYLICISNLNGSGRYGTFFAL